MSTLLIDYDTIIRKNNLALLQNRVAPTPETKYTLGLILVIFPQQFQALESIPKGIGRINYINSVSFIDSILGYAYLIYDKKKKVCEIMGNVGDISVSRMLEGTLFNLPNDVLLWVGFDLTNPMFNSLVDNYVREGFDEPYICKTSPLGFSFSTHGLCMIRKNDIVKNNYVLNDVRYVLTQFITKQHGICNLRAYLSDESIYYLYKLTRMGSTLNDDGIITQKEVAGKLIAGKVNNDLSYSLIVDRDSIKSGSEEAVEIIGGLYNFHSHPQEAYERNNVKLGWPSAQDYIGYMNSSLIYDTILHIVTAIEGFYVISLTEYWVNNKYQLNDSTSEFIGKEYNICYSTAIEKTVSWYIKRVNSISYYGYPIFLVQFFSWNESRTIFEVPFRKSGINCFSRESTLIKYKELYQR